MRKCKNDLSLKPGHLMRFAPLHPRGRRCLPPSLRKAGHTSTGDDALLQSWRVVEPMRPRRRHSGQRAEQALLGAALCERGKVGAKPAILEAELDPIIGLRRVEPSSSAEQPAPRNTDGVHIEITRDHIFSSRWTFMLTSPGKHLHAGSQPLKAASRFQEPVELRPSDLGLEAMSAKLELADL